MQHYKSIKDISQWNWSQCGSTSDMRYCRVDFDGEDEVEALVKSLKEEDFKGLSQDQADRVVENIAFISINKDLAAYEIVRDEYVYYFGLNKDAVKLNNLQNKLVSHMLDMMITGNPQIQNYINRLEYDIEKIVEDMPDRSEKDQDKNWMHVIAKTNFPMDTKKISAYNYRLVIENHSEEIERQNAAIKKQMKDGK